MNNEYIHKWMLWRDIIREAKKITEMGYGKVTFVCIPDKEIKNYGKDDNTAGQADD